MDVKGKVKSTTIAELISARPHDALHIHQVAYVKRFLERFLADEKFRNAYCEKPQALLNQYRVPFNADELHNLFTPAFYLLGDIELPMIMRRYRAYLVERRNLRILVQNELGGGTNKAFEAWRKRQMNRCKGEFGNRSRSIIHHPIAFELTTGRSVVDSFRFRSGNKPLTRIFRASQENLALWQSILHSTYNLFGKTVNPCYFATDPMDNIEYKDFVNIYQKIYQYIPQVATSMALQDIERTRQFLKNAAMMPTMHQFFVHSLEDFHQLMNAFSPEDLLYVDLVLDFPQAKKLKDVVIYENQAQKAEYVKMDSLMVKSVIDCSGFVVNMPEQRIRLTTPCNIDYQHPQGNIILAETEFSNAIDFEEKIRQLIKMYMPLEVDRTKVITFQPYYRYTKQKGGFSLESMAKYKWTFLDDIELNQPVYRLVGELLDEDMYTSREIATLLMDQEIKPEITFACIQSLFDAGVLEERE